MSLPYSYLDMKGPIDPMNMQRFKSEKGNCIVLTRLFKLAPTSLKLHSRYMKTQHIKFEILNERLSVFKCNLIQLNFVLNILLIGRICDANFHPFGDVRDDVTRSLNVCHR